MHFLVLIAAMFFVPFAETPSPDPNELIAQALRNYAANQDALKNYEYKEVHSERIGSSLAKVTTYDVMMIENQVYRPRLVAGQPVQADQERLETQLMQQKLRRDADDAVRGSESLHANQALVVEGATPSIPLTAIPEFFNLQIKEKTVLNGRPAYLLIGVPKENPSGELISDPRTFKLKIWVDIADTHIARLKATAMREGLLRHPSYVKLNPRDFRNAKEAEQISKHLSESWEKYGLGTTITMDWSKVSDDAWIPTRVHVKGTFIEPQYMSPVQLGQILGDGSIEVSFDFDTVRNECRKFQVAHRILPSSNQQ
jgi:hypothetical protein